MRSTYHHNTVVKRRLALLALSLANLLAVLLGTSAAQAATSLVISGAGEGHGVGMSQEGALGFSQHGYDYQSILAHYYTNTTLGSASASAQVRVLLAANRHSISFNSASQVNGQTLNTAATYTVTLTSAGPLLRGPGVRISARSLTVTGASELRLLGSQENGVRNGLYRGALVFVAAQHGGLNAINQVGLEDYVRGTIAAEMPSSWPAAALQAQAVASRTYAITTHVSSSGAFDLYCDTRSQMYQGVAAETARSNAAVNATAHQIVTYGGRPAVTFFFASSGGQTESAQNAFGGSAEPWLRGVSDPYDRGPLHSWTVTMSFSSAAARLGGLVRGHFRGIEVARRGDSPRILSAYVLGSAGRTTVTGAELAARLGLHDSWAYFSVRTAHGSRPEPDLSVSAPQPPATPPSTAVSGAGGTSAG